MMKKDWIVREVTTSPRGWHLSGDNVCVVPHEKFFWGFHRPSDFEDEPRFDFDNAVGMTEAAREWLRGRRG